MPQVAGSDCDVLLYHESVWGEDPTGDGMQARRGYFVRLGLEGRRNLITSEVISGGRGVRRPALGNLAVAGSARIEMAPQSAGFWLANLLGAPTDTGSGPYTHVYVPAALRPGFRIEKDWRSKLPGKVERFRGLRISSATFTFPAEGFVTMDAELVGRDHAVIAAPLDPDAIADPHPNGFSGFEGTVKRGGTIMGACISGTLTVDNSLRTDLYTFASGGLVYGLPEGRARISGRLSLVFEDFTLFDLALARTETTFEFLLSRGTGLGTANNESLSFLVDHADITLASPPLETEAGITVDVDYVGFASGADMGLKVTLKNALAGGAY